MTDEEAMELALAEARRAIEHEDVPVGAVILRDDGTVVASRHNERQLTGDPTAHAEVLALRDAAEAAGSWRLDDYTLVVTLEPSTMGSRSLWTPWRLTSEPLRFSDVATLSIHVLRK